MMSNREALDIPELDDDLGDFAPRGGAGREAVTPLPASQTRRSVDAVSKFPSREPSGDAQLNLKGPRPILDRFRRMCKEDRRTYYDMLDILMTHFEGKATDK